MKNKTQFFQSTIILLLTGCLFMVHCREDYYEASAECMDVTKIANMPFAAPVYDSKEGKYLLLQLTNDPEDGCKVFLNRNPFSIQSKILIGARLLGVAH